MSAVTLFEYEGHYAREVGAQEVPRLQALFDASPEYSLTVNGRKPHANEAQLEFDEMPPPEFTFTRRWFLGLFEPSHELAGNAVIIEDLIADKVWHIGLFLVATRLHGKGIAQGLYDALEAWMRSRGAEWLRLGVVSGNGRAERFWQRNAYVETRTRPFDTGGRMNTVRVMVKPLREPLTAECLDAYLARVPRDRPEPVVP